jgi:hypothetical protein
MPKITKEIADLTDSSGGTAGNTIAAAGSSYSQADENNFRASVAAKINEIIQLLKEAGIISRVE